jgi:hypothetical protein
MCGPVGVRSRSFDSYGLPWPASGPVPPPHVPAQVVPAAQSCERWPLHSTWHAVVPPHSTVHPALPPHSAVHPPAGHLIVQVLLPVHARVEPAPSDAVQLLPPPQVTVLLVPVASWHVLVPVHVDVQFDPQLPSHVDWPAQLLVQPVPHERSQVFFVWQLNVALSGGALDEPPSPPSVPPPSALAVPLALPPKEHLPPALQSQVSPEQMQSPVHDGLGIAAPSLLPQPAARLKPEPIATSAHAVITKDNRRSFMRKLRSIV